MLKVFFLHDDKEMNVFLRLIVMLLWIFTFPITYWLRLLGLDKYIFDIIEIKKFKKERELEKLIVEEEAESIMNKYKKYKN